MQGSAGNPALLFLLAIPDQMSVPNSRTRYSATVFTQFWHIVSKRPWRWASRLSSGMSINPPSSSRQSMRGRDSKAGSLAAERRSRLLLVPCLWQDTGQGSVFKIRAGHWPAVCTLFWPSGTRRSVALLPRGEAGYYLCPGFAGTLAKVRTPFSRVTIIWPGGTLIFAAALQKLVPRLRRDTGLRFESRIPKKRDP